MTARLLVVGILTPPALVLFSALGCGQSRPSSVRSEAEISLPNPSTSGGMSVAEAIAKRRSIRKFADEPLTPNEISQLVWAAQGITEPNRKYRAAPSAGALYPLKLYLLTHEGIFHYIPERHSLLPIESKDRRNDLSRAALGQSFVADAALSFVITADYARTQGTYGDRAPMYVHMEAGHVAENIHLQAVALGLGSVPVGAFRDQAVSDIVGLSSDYTPLYIILVGHPR